MITEHRPDRIIGLYHNLHPSFLLRGVDPSVLGSAHLQVQLQAQAQL
jgi:hypothetical protein